MMNQQFLHASEKLQLALQKQIAILREILTNLQQEQSLICTRSLEALQSVYLSRQMLHEELKGVKKQRLEHEKTLGKQGPSTELEISQMRKQIDTLMKKMRLQKEANAKLHTQADSLEKAQRMGLVPMETKKKGKIEVATQD